MSYDISVVVCTHNPHRDNFQRVLSALKSQDLSLEKWELLIVDNASDAQLSEEVDLTWHPHARCVREKLLGLTKARLCGFKRAKSSIITFADDDNVLDSDFLENVLQIADRYPQLGAFGGKVIPEFEAEPEKWVRSFDNALAIRDFGNEVLCCNGSAVLGENAHYPYYAPIGAGLVLRREAAKVYTDSLKMQPDRLSFGRNGNQLTSGEDNDIILTILKAGWGIGYFPQLKLTHLISANRITKQYLARLNYAASRSWVQVLDIHGLRPWKKISRWSISLRKVKAFFTYQAWRSEEAFIRWRGACGLFEGLSTL